MTSQRLALAALAVALAVLGGACSDDTETVTTTAAVVDSPDEVVFGSGSLPETLPDGFPLPAGSAVGSTMVVAQSGFTEAVVRIAAELGITAQFFDQSLAVAGITVDSSAAVDDGWLIEFTSEGAKGTIEISEPREGVSQAIVRFNVP